MASRILLIGMMGAGKTTIGELLARRLGADYRDSDALVEAAVGQTVREIWETEGEAAFRREETAALERALATTGPAVVAVAGGAVLSETNRALLKHAGTVVWLRAEPETLVARTASGTHRPLLGDDPATTLRRLAAERFALYAEVSDVIIDVDERTPDEVVHQIMEHIG